MNPILVTGVGGRVGGIGQKVVDLLLMAKLPVRALVRSESVISDSLKAQGAEIIVGDLTDLDAVHRAMENVDRMYFGMGVSPQYLEATTNVAAVAKYHGLKAIVNISQMTVSEMTVTTTTESPQQKLHWLGEQVLNWSGMPVIHIRATVFMENPLFYAGAVESISKADEIRLPFGLARTSPIAASDVARVVAKILENPFTHIGNVYEITGAALDMKQLAILYSAGLGRAIAYIDMPYLEWKKNELDTKDFPSHVAEHIATMARLHAQNRYDRKTAQFKMLTGQEPMAADQWVALKQAEFAPRP